MQKAIVVGGGILGASTAYELSEKGVEVTLVDRGDKGQATDAAAGIVCPWLSQRRNQDWYQLAKKGAAYYPSLVSRLEEDGETETGYDKVGAISLHSDASKLDAMVKRAMKRRETAPEIGEINRLSQAETQTLFPILADGYGSVHVSGAARVDGRALRTALVHAAEKHGMTLVKGDARLLFSGRTVTGVKVNGKELYADTVIVAAGSWGRELLQPLGLDFMVSWQRAELIHLHLPGTSTEKWPVVMPPGNHYLLAFPGGKVVGGTTYEDNAPEARTTAGGMHEIFQKAFGIAPSLARATVIEARAGFRPFTPGFLPVFGTLPAWEGILVGNGLGATGLTMGPFIGLQLAKLAVGEQTDIETEAYSPVSALEK